jgi:hypothetical protein
MVVADPAADSGQGTFLQKDGQRPVIVTFGGLVEGTGDIVPNGTCGAAWGSLLQKEGT